jgi:hypothetical protein
MSKLAFKVKLVINLSVSLFLFTGGIILFAIAFALPTLLPITVLILVKNTDLMVAGVILIVISLGPFATFLNMANFEWDLWKSLHSQTHFELVQVVQTHPPPMAEIHSVPKKPTEVDAEQMWYRRSENIIIMADRLFHHWDGQDVQRVINNLPNPGEIHFPSTANFEPPILLKH